MTTAGVVITFAGSAGSAGSTDATGSSARFYNPTGITTDGTDLYTVAYYGELLKKIVVSTGAVTTLAGTYTSSGGTDGVGSAARFYLPEGISSDGTNVFVADGRYS